ncbi:MAG: hypothetical protein PWQ09_339 [Candidatus Cloacimonadota bacterium]|nr:hypothetical protein [Candidatus Cloacimonadota bacterium]
MGVIYFLTLGWLLMKKITSSLTTFELTDYLVIFWQDNFF